MSVQTTPVASRLASGGEQRRPWSYAWRRARSRIPLWHLLWLLVGALVFLVPLYALVQYSFSGLASGQSPFHWYLTVFDDPQFGTSFWMSLQIALETVVVGLLLMVPTAFWVHLRLPRLRPAMDLVSVLPFVVPPIVLIVGLIAFLRPFTWLIDRPEVLALIYVVFALPFLYRSLDAGLRAMDLQTLTEAAESLGSSTARTLFTVVLPNLRAAIIGGALLTVAIAMGEFTIASLLAFNTYPVYIYNIGTSQSYEAGALSVISLLLTWGAMLALFVLGRGGRTPTQTGIIK
ncbi:MAG TPA: ABC transporter permease subunit [Acidimicrobiales bacterium]|nr:ABC transporter permease subunit [Acidimicrobiales bacterium]